jgi:hypothetical protein
MKKKIAMDWVKALRSGKYEQGQGTLKTEDGKFCCLGVLREIGYAPMSYTWDGSLSDRDSEVCGMSNVGTECVGMTQSELAKLNDGGATFDEIADLIEVCWEDM